MTVQNDGCDAGRVADAGWRWLGRCCLVAGMAVVLVVCQLVCLAGSQTSSPMM